MLSKIINAEMAKTWKLYAELQFMRSTEEDNLKGMKHWHDQILACNKIIKAKENVNKNKSSVIHI